MGQYPGGLPLCSARRWSASESRGGIISSCAGREHRYPPDKQEKATQTVLEQAEAQSHSRSPYSFTATATAASIQRSKESAMSGSLVLQVITNGSKEHGEKSRDVNCLSSESSKDSRRENTETSIISGTSRPTWGY